MALGMTVSLPATNLENVEEIPEWAKDAPDTDAIDLTMFCRDIDFANEALF